jgi:hypothetical protein
VTLSEAIRLGTALRPNQAFNVLFDPADPTATCALGAASEAVGILDVTQRNSYVGKAPKSWRWTSTRWGVLYSCPSCWWRAEGQDIIIHLNNDHRWTRLQIADWVEVCERELTPQPTQEVTVDA